MALDESSLTPFTDEQIGKTVRALFDAERIRNKGVETSNVHIAFGHLLTALRPPFVTVTQGMSGYFAVMMHWNEDNGGFWEPYDTAIARHVSHGAAVEDAKHWAHVENLEYRE